MSQKMNPSDAEAPTTANIMDPSIPTIAYLDEDVPTMTPLSEEDFVSGYFMSPLAVEEPAAANIMAPTIITTTPIAS